MFLEEIKRQFSWKRGVTILLLILALTIYWSYFIINGSGVGLMMKGFYKPQGIYALRKDKEAVKDVEGSMSVSNFVQAAKEYETGKIEGETFELTEGILKFHKYIDMLIMQEVDLQKLKGEETVSFEKLTEEMGEYFYQREEERMDYKIKEEVKSISEREEGKRLWSKVEKPYTYYFSADVWRDGLEHISIMSIPLSIIAGYVSLGIISRDGQSNMDEMIASSPKQKKLYWTRVLISIGSSVIIYVVAMGIYLGILSYFLGVEGLSSSIQIISSSILNFKLKDVLFWSIALGMIGMISFSLWGLFLSSRKIPLLAAIVLLVGIRFLNIALSLNVPNSIWLNFLPGSGMMAYYHTLGVPLTTIFGKTMWWLKVNLCSGFILSIILALLGKIRRR